MRLNDITECERCSGVDIDQLESDLKTAHEMIREFREVLQYCLRDDVDGEHYGSEVKKKVYGKREARAVLEKWKGKLNENT